MSEGNTQSKSRSRKWRCALNNYTAAELEHLTQLFKEHCLYYIIGKEMGEEGTPHLQIYVEFKNQRYFGGVKSFCERMHLEKAKGSRESNFHYCSKENNFITNDKKYLILEKRKKRLDKYSEVVWKPWQQEVLDIINGEVDERKIYFFVDEEGNSGKSFLTKFIYLSNKDKCIITNSNATVSTNQIRKHLQMGKDIKICLADVPRCVTKYMSYQTIENLKDGLFYSGKYKGGICCFKPPHVIVFMNKEPDMEALSPDRYEIYHITL